MLFAPFSWTLGFSKTLAGYSPLAQVLLMIRLPCTGWLKHRCRCTAYPKASGGKLASPRAAIRYPNINGFPFCHHSYV